MPLPLKHMSLKHLPLRRLRAGVAALLAIASAMAFAVETDLGKPEGIKPFSADYQASYLGLQGSGKMTLAPAGGDRWNYNLDISAAGAQSRQSTLFEHRGGQWRPLSGVDATNVLIKRSNKRATYDWARGEARWSGDVKPDRAGPVKLQAGDLDAPLIYLAIARDTAAGKPLHYRMVDDGRVRQLNFERAGQDTVSIDGKTQPATKVVRTDGNKQTLLWIVDGLPAPARILHRKDGADEIDLRIKSLR